MWQLELFSSSNLSYSAESNLIRVRRCSRRLLLRCYSSKRYCQTIHVLIQLTYEQSCFNKVFNTKRSSCEQSGAKIAWKAIANFKKRREDFFTIEEFCKLRRSTTEREKRAVFWFFHLFLECVCAANTWRKVKKTTLVSEAQGDGNCKIVTKSYEAFALLLIENYLEKWETILEAGVGSANTEPAVNNNNSADADGEANGRQKKKKKESPRKVHQKEKWTL
jgi:hypothetical protein